MSYATKLGKSGKLGKAGAPGEAGHFQAPHLQAPMPVIRLGRDDGLNAEILPTGCALRSLSIPASSGRKELIVSLPKLEDYIANPYYVGAVIGRCANRIAQGKFETPNGVFHLTQNEKPHHLHGGEHNFSRRFWTLLNVEHGPNHRAWFTLKSLDGEEGYPGDLNITALFEVRSDRLLIRFEACTNKLTPVNLTMHPYFNLSGNPGICAHRQKLTINARHFLPITPETIPTGDFAATAQTPFDFMNGGVIGERLTERHKQLQLCGGFDHAFVLNSAEAATLSSPDSGVTMRITTNQPAIQFYDGRKLHLPDAPHWTGVCLEPESHPNGVNTPAFPSALLAPGETYIHETMYQFSVKA